MAIGPMYIGSSILDWIISIQNYMDMDIDIIR